MFNKIKKTIDNNNQDKVNECAKEVDKVLSKYNCQILPVTQIAGGQIRQFTQVVLKPTKDEVEKLDNNYK